METTEAAQHDDETLALSDDEIGPTQRLEDDNLPTTTKETNITTTEYTTTVGADADANATITTSDADANESFDVASASPSAKPFAATFGIVWRVLVSLGWQTAQGPGTEFVSMPGTQFFNFRPNMNVFDSKAKACWKWLALAADREAVSSEEQEVWDALWTVAEAQLGWYTMSSGDETWFVRPNTQFHEFQPNVTIFQSKKRAVLQALKLSKVKVTLGDSVDGVQVLDFATNPSKAKKEKKEPKSKSDSFTTPSPKKKKSASSAAASSTKKAASKTTPTSTKKAGKPPKKASTPAKTSGKSPNIGTPKSTKKTKVVESPKPEPPLVFHAPEFKCTFGHVYKKLQERGWHHKVGPFEYDYFSPDFTKETAILNGNYFQSAAEFESFLKDSGIWADIEGELRDEHMACVEELREEAEEKRRKNKERQAAKEAKSKSKSTPSKDITPSVQRSPAKKKKKSVFKMAQEAQSSTGKRKSLESVDVPPKVKITMGKVVDRLVKRGWHYKPGRFEYDYFKPNANIKTAKLGEDYFQSEAELETYLKVSGIWSEIAQEIRDEFEAAQLTGDDESEKEAPKDKKTTPASAKKPRVESHGPSRSKSPREEKSEAEVEAEPLEPAAVALSNDIWGNTNQFDFEKY